MAGELIVFQDGAIGVLPDGSAGVVANDGRCPSCGCGPFDDGDPDDPPPPWDPDGGYFLGSPCDPSAPPLNLPVAVYVPPQRDRQPGTYKWDCTSTLVTDSAGNTQCYFITRRSPRIEGEVVDSPTEPFTIGGVRYLRAGSGPEKNTCCACRLDCGTFRGEKFKAECKSNNGLSGSPNCLPGWTPPTETCCCDAAGEMKYDASYRSVTQTYTQDPYTGAWLPVQEYVTQLLSGSAPNNQVPGDCRFVVLTEIHGWRDDGGRLVPNIVTSILRDQIGRCQGCDYPLFLGEPWECLTRADAVQCECLVEYKCGQYTGTKRCELSPAGPGAPIGIWDQSWRQNVNYTQGNCTGGCDEATTTPPPAPLIGGGAGAPGGVPRLF